MDIFVFLIARILQIVEIQYKDSFGYVGQITMEASLNIRFVAAVLAGSICFGLCAPSAEADGPPPRTGRDIARNPSTVVIAHRHKRYHRAHTIYYGVRYSYPRTSPRYAWPYRGYYDYGRLRDYEHYW